MYNFSQTGARGWGWWYEAMTVSTKFKGNFRGAYSTCCSCEMATGIFKGNSKRDWLKLETVLFFRVNGFWFVQRKQLSETNTRLVRSAFDWYPSLLSNDRICVHFNSRILCTIRTIYTPQIKRPEFRAIGSPFLSPFNNQTLSSTSPSLSSSNWTWFSGGTTTHTSFY